MSSLIQILNGVGPADLQVPSRGSAVTVLRHHVGADVIVAALANTLGTMVMPLADQAPTTLGAPLELLARRRVIPLGRVIESGVRYAVVGMSDPTDDAAVRELVSAIGMPARRVLVHDDDLTRALLAMERKATPDYKSIEAPPLDLDEGPTQMDIGVLPGAAPRGKSSDHNDDDDDGDDDGDDDDDSIPFASAVSIASAGDEHVNPTDVHARAATLVNNSSVFTSSVTPTAVSATPPGPAVLSVDLDEGPTTRIEIPRVMLVMSGGGADDVVEAVVKHVPGILVYRDPSDPAVLADTSRIAVFVEVPGAPFSHGVLEGLLWRRQQLIVVSGDAGLDAIAGVTRVEPDKGGLVGAIIRGVFGLPNA